MKSSLDEIFGAKNASHAPCQIDCRAVREINPALLKYALSLLGLISPRVRLPLVELTGQIKTEVAAVLGTDRQ